ncbi:hypothetical protein [Prochlorococcus marinus]|uniref:hypothetical protein n=1 Tax=Prochlorococcus marinus TaxID=1219 RepID=UPI0022B476BE|nr:hypothetical protein [Prochlorococcus marinus]
MQSKSEIIASSAGWVSALLNFIPGLGTGYLYQRRWRAYWITSLVSAFWVYFDFSRQLAYDPSDPAGFQGEDIGFLGLIAISSITAFEAALKVKNEREILKRGGASLSKE